MSDLKLYFLGPPRVEVDNETVEIKRNKGLALLAYLAVTGDRHRRQALATLFWPDSSQRNALGSLRRDLWILNENLAREWLEIDRDTVLLRRASGFWLDVEQFQCWTAAGQRPSDQAVPGYPVLLTNAVELYRDDFLSGFTLRNCPDFDEWQFFQTENLRQSFGIALERLIQAFRGLGNYETAVVFARRWLALDPWHEPAHRTLMQLFAKSGQRAAALRQYALCTQTLREELGTLPSAETAALYERIRSGAIGKGADETRVEIVSSSSSTSPRVNARLHELPPQPTPFVGREDELADITQHLTDPECRLLTLVGAGGIGKTRMALQAARSFMDTQPARAIAPDGGVFVALVSVDSSDGLVSLIGGALGFLFPDAQEPRRQLLHYLREKRFLLLLDNFEHLLPDAELVADILRTAPGVQILVTSRERLRLQSEQVYPVGGFEIPDFDIRRDAEAHAAVKLFLQSARRIQPHFELAVADYPYLTDICRFTGGMPLAIELAAAWVGSLSLAGIATEIGRSVEFLQTDLRDLPDRHRSVQGIFDSSWQMLSLIEQHVLTRLSIFRGGFTRRASEEVAGATLLILAALANKSLLQYSKRHDRYDVHELLRQCAAKRLESEPEEEAVARDRHSGYYCGLLQQWETGLKGAGQQGVLEEIEADLENVRVAWSWAVGRGKVERLALGMDCLGGFCDSQGRWFEGETVFRAAAKRLEKLFRKFPDDTKIAVALAKSLAWQGMFGWILRRSLGVDSERGSAMMRKSLDLLEGPTLAGEEVDQARAFVVQQLGRMTMGTGRADRIQEAQGYLEQSLKLYASINDKSGIADVLYELNFLAALSGLHDKAKQLLADSMALYQELGDRRRIARSLIAVGWNARQAGAYNEAQRLFEEAYTLSEAQRDRWWMADALGHMGYLAGFLGQFEKGAGFFQQSVTLWREIGHRATLAMHLSNWGQMKWFSGFFAEGCQLIEQALNVQQELSVNQSGTITTLANANLYAGRYDTARAMLKGIQEPDGAVGAQRVLGWVALAEGDYGEAEARLRKVVAASAATRNWWTHETRAYDQAFLGRALFGLGEQAEAQRNLYEALHTATKIQAFVPLMYLMATIPVVLADTEDNHTTEWAVELYALASSHPFVANSRLLEDIAGRHVKTACFILPPEVAVAARARGRALDWWEAADKLLEELGRLGWSG